MIQPKPSRAASGEVQKRVLDYVQSLNGAEMTIKELAERLAIDKQQLSRTVSRLADRGLLSSGLRVRDSNYSRVVNPTPVTNDKKRRSHHRKTAQASLDALEGIERKPLLIPEEVLPKIDQLVNAGFSYARIAKAFKVGETTINKAHHRKGPYARFSRVG